MNIHTFSLSLPDLLNYKDKKCDAEFYYLDGEIGVCCLKKQREINRMYIIIYKGQVTYYRQRCSDI